MSDIKVEIQIDWDSEAAVEGADYRNNPDLRAPLVLLVGYELYRNENLLQMISHFEKVKEALVALGANPTEIVWTGEEIVAHVIETEEMTKERFAKEKAKKAERHRSEVEDAWKRFHEASKDLVSLGEMGKL